MPINVYFSCYFSISLSVTIEKQQNRQKKYRYAIAELSKNKPVGDWFAR